MARKRGILLAAFIALSGHCIGFAATHGYTGHEPHFWDNHCVLYATMVEGMHADGAKDEAGEKCFSVTLNVLATVTGDYNALAVAQPTSFRMVGSPFLCMSHPVGSSLLVVVEKTKKGHVINNSVFAFMPQGCSAAKVGDLAGDRAQAIVKAVAESRSSDSDNPAMPEEVSISLTTEERNEIDTAAGDVDNATWAAWKLNEATR